MERLLDINPFLEVEIFPEGINKENAREIIEGLDVIIDASDNKSAHYPLHRVAKELKVPVISREHRVPEFTLGAKGQPMGPLKVDGTLTEKDG